MIGVIVGIEYQNNVAIKIFLQQKLQLSHFLRGIPRIYN